MSSSAVPITEAYLSAVQKESALGYSAWYPPVQRALLCLGKVYRCIDGRIFGGLAQEAVAAATAAAQAASRLVAKRARHPQLCLCD